MSPRSDIAVMTVAYPCNYLILIPVLILLSPHAQRFFCQVINIESEIILAV